MKTTPVGRVWLTKAFWGLEATLEWFARDDGVDGWATRQRPSRPDDAGHASDSFQATMADRKLLTVRQ